MAHKLKKITKSMIKEGFPELENIVVDVGWSKPKKSYAGVKRVSSSEYYLYLHKSLKKAPEKVVKGFVAHELGHVATTANMMRYEHVTYRILYNQWSKFRTWDERRTDTLAVERGFGKELIASMKYHNKHREKYNSKDGLLISEVKDLMNNQVNRASI